MTRSTDPEILSAYFATMRQFLATQSRVMSSFLGTQPADAEAYLRRKGYSFPAAWIGPAPSGAYAKPDGLPVTVVRGPDGRVLQAEKGQLFHEDVAQLARWL